MKQGWEIKKLGDCFRLKSGEMLSSKMMEKGSFPVYGGNGIAGSHRLFNLSGNNVIIGRVGALCGNVRNIIENIWLTDNAFQVVDYKFKFDNVFLTYLLNYKNLRDYARQAAQPVISNSSLNDIIIEFPTDINEQRRIVSILDQTFASITQAKENAQRNLQNAKELFESYLQGVLENKGEGWEHISLGEICKINDGTHFSPKNTNEGEFMYITAKNIKPYYIDLTNISYISGKDHREIYARCSPKKGDVLYIKDGATAGIATINSIEEEFSLLSSVALLKCSSKILNSFLVHYMNSRLGRANFLGYIDGAAITRLTLIKIKNVCLSLPPITQQRNIVQKFDALFTETKRLEAIYQQKLLNLEELKKSVLQKAFNGEL
jgi:type I restriction enzyme, S subunit